MHNFMKTDNIITEKTKKFAIRIIRLYQHLQKQNKGAIEVLSVIAMRNKCWGKCSRSGKSAEQKGF